MLAGGFRGLLVETHRLEDVLFIRLLVLESLMFEQMEIGLAVVLGFFGFENPLEFDGKFGVVFQDYFLAVFVVCLAIFEENGLGRIHLVILHLQLRQATLPHQIHLLIEVLLVPDLNHFLYQTLGLGEKDHCELLNLLLLELKLLRGDVETPVLRHTNVEFPRPSHILNRKQGLAFFPKPTRQAPNRIVYLHYGLFENALHFVEEVVFLRDEADVVLIVGSLSPLELHCDGQ